MTPKKLAAVIFRDLPYDTIDHTSGCSITADELGQILRREGYGDFPTLSFKLVDGQIVWSGIDAEGNTISGTLSLKASVSPERVGVYTEVLVKSKSDDMAERVAGRYAHGSRVPQPFECGSLGRAPQLP